MIIENKELKAFAALTEEEQEYILKAKGGTIDFFNTDGEWNTTQSPLFLPNAIYRTKPEPRNELKVFDIRYKKGLPVADLEHARDFFLHSPSVGGMITVADKIYYILCFVFADGSEDKHHVKIHPTALNIEKATAVKVLIEKVK